MVDIIDTTELEMLLDNFGHARAVRAHRFNDANDQRVKQSRDAVLTYVKSRTFAMAAAFEPVPEPQGIMHWWALTLQKVTQDSHGNTTTSTIEGYKGTEGHFLTLDDIADLKQSLDMVGSVVMGTGYIGRMTKGQFLGSGQYGYDADSKEEEGSDA